MGLGVTRRVQSRRLAPLSKIKFEHAAMSAT